MDDGTKESAPAVDPAAWSPDDVEKSGNGCHHFTAGELEELAALARERSDDGRGKRLDRPLLTSRMAATARELKSGVGFRILRGLPLTGLNESEVAHAFSTLSRHIGDVVEQPGGVHLAHVRAEPENRDRVGFRAAGELPFHADPEDVIGFLCMNPARTGGTRRFVSAATVYNILAKQHPDVLDVLTRPFHVALQHPHPDHGHRWSQLPFLGFQDGVFNACAFPVHIKRAQKQAGVPELTEAQRHALEVFNSVANTAAAAVELQPGDIEYFNNHVVLHTRTRFADAGSGRHLLRVWLSVAGFRTLHPEHPVRLKERMKGRRIGRPGAVRRQSLANRRPRPHSS